MNDNKMRKAVTKLVMIAVIITMIGAPGAPALAFSPDESRSVENFFIEANLLKGDGSGYGLENSANRLEGTIILLRLMGKEAEAQDMADLPCRFTDVPDWAKGYVNYADAANISKGVGDTLFGVADKITAQQYNTLLLRSLGYDDSRGDFRWDKSLDKAEELAILPGDMVQEHLWKDSYTKGDLMETSFCYLEADLKDQDQTLIGMLTDTGAIPDDLAEKYGLNIKGWDSVTTGFNENDYLNFNISGNVLNVTGASEDEDKTYLLIHVGKTDTGAKKAEKTGRLNGEGRYDIRLSLENLPKGEYYIDVYGNDEKYNYYTSFILSSLILQKTEDGMHFKAAPVYGRNLRIHNGSRLEALDYEMTPSAKSSEGFIAAISGLAEEITAGLGSDYEKVQAIHDWVAEEIYYDRDYLNGKTQRTNINSIAVLDNRYAVCSGYANLTNDLLAAAGIPGREVIGFARGVTDDAGWDEMELQRLEPNHVWNEVYVDGRWIIVDTTWDSDNTYEDGKFTKGGVSRLYFDITVPFLSNTHKVIMP